MSLVDVISKFIGLPVVISVASLIFLIINNINIRDVEKMLLTNYQRLQIFIGNIFVNWVLYVTLLMVILYKDLIKEENIGFVSIVISLMALVLACIVYIPIQIGVYFNPIITTVCIEFSGEKWKILRVAGKSRVLLRREPKSNEGYCDIITYHNLDSIKEKEIGLQYELKNNIYYNIVRKFTTWNSPWKWVPRIVGSIAIIVINSYLLFKCNDKPVLWVVSALIFSIIIVVNMHISFLEKAKKLHPEIFQINL
ncbi:hypothetical protein P5763_17790 [Bacillus cereus]|uniref:hypothetical protein n=2 Tax=Bacillus cereus group TaxID=86661 RepID=UPI0024068B5A|nr:hypothetical protein [Bacillus cereus]MDF9613897.1 hypothetical protein [Bacillus cereus]